MSGHAHVPELRPLTRKEQDLVDANLGLIGTTVGIYCQGALRDGYDYDDAWQDGYLGLCRAAQVFDPDRAALSTLAVQRIRSQVQRGKGVYGGLNHRRADKLGTPHETAVSLDAHVGDDLSTLEQFVAAAGDEPDGALIAEDLVDRLRSTCADVVDRMLFEAIIGDTKVTLDDIAVRVGMTRQGVSLRRKRLLGRLQKQLGRHLEGARP